MAPEAAGDTITNRCACGWEVTGPIDEVIAATIDHGSRIHNMVATREDVLAALGRAPNADERRAEPA
jgi:predicted small metal-binding protein